MRNNNHCDSLALEENLKKALTEFLLLYILSQKDSYIGELTEELRHRSHGALNIVFPYAAIYRLLQSGYVYETKKQIAPDGRRRQYYAISESGKEHLAQNLEAYNRFSKGIADVFKKGDNDI